MACDTYHIVSVHITLRLKLYDVVLPKTRVPLVCAIKSSAELHNFSKEVEAVFTWVTASVFSVIDGNFYEPFFVVHLMGVRLNFDVEVKILLSTLTPTAPT